MLVESAEDHAFKGVLGWPERALRGVRLSFTNTIRSHLGIWTLSNGLESVSHELRTIALIKQRIVRAPYK